MDSNIFPSVEDIPQSEGLPPAARSDSTPSVPPDIRPQASGADDLRRRFLLRRFWKSARGFWGQRGHRLAWPLCSAIFAVIILNLVTLYGVNIWNRGIFDALERRNSGRVFELALIYLPLLAASVCLAVVQVYARMTTQRCWRAWLNDHLLDRWLANGLYYQLNLVSGDHQNPEFRIADDVRVATEAPVDFATGVVSAFLSAATFRSCRPRRPSPSCRPPSIGSLTTIRGLRTGPPPLGAPAR